MAQYIDGFVLPIPQKRQGDYRRLVESIAGIWIEHGALDYFEYIGDDMNLPGTRSFTEVVDANASEVVVFGWVVFESREARDLANEKVASDPRMEKLVDSSNSGFDPARMVYGGFQLLAKASNSNS